MKPDPAGRLARAKEALAGGRTREALRLAQELAASPAAPQELRVEALCLEAEVHRRLGRPAEALAALEQALALAPERPALHYWRGRLLDGMGRIREASEALEQACRLAPRWAEAHSWAGHLCARLGDHPRRLAHQEAILRMRPTDRAALYNRASALLATTRVEEALAAFRQARSVEERPEYVAGEVTALLQLGRHEEAWRLLQPWLSAAPPQHSLGIAFADLAPRLGRVEEAIAYLRGLLDREAALNDIQRQSLHFALGRLYDRAGNPDRAFLHLHTANEMAPRAFPAAGWERFLERTLAVFPPEAAAQAPRARRRDPRPVLILGMPRSGTSLVEQILASHPRVHGAGELHALERLGLELLERAEEAGGLSGLPVELLDGLAERYLAKAGREAGPAARITDKMPTNFLWLGTAMLALPGARVV
ncbi:MAG: sulfotransferase family protein, partial [Gammaproteobacteria bacterium]